mgnify:CR=1 FL=1
MAEASAHLRIINDRDNDDRSDLDTDLVMVRQAGAGLGLAFLGTEQRDLYITHVTRDEGSVERAPVSPAAGVTSEQPPQAPPAPSL